VTAISTTRRPVTGRPVPDDDVLDLLWTWIPRQRWYPAKGTDARADRVATVDLVDPAREAAVQLHIFRLPSGALLQVPTTIRAAGHQGPGVVGQVTSGTLVDGPQDPAFVRAWLAAADDDGVRLGGDLTGLRILGGEQSNTSVVLPELRPPAILKVFRGLTAGPNPDVDVPLALARSGWSGVPRPLAWLAGTWPNENEESQGVGHLGVLSELVQGAQDGFELACAYAGEGRDLAGPAHALGRTMAQMHHALRVALPVGDLPATRAPLGAVAEVARLLRERAAAAAAEVPALAERWPDIERVLTTVGAMSAVPPVQRVHGDFHLGQVLRSADATWYVLDFEGEPQASASEKARPDLALRDVAGMLRSIDYAAAVGGAASEEWTASARRALVEGYRSESHRLGDAPTDGSPGGLLRVLELDKAVYEVVYESRNRPDWVPIPLAGVDRLLGRG